MRITRLNKMQGNDFIMKHMQNNIEVIGIERFEEYHFHLVTIRSGKWWDRKEITKWHYSEKLGLNCGYYKEPCSGKEYTINDFDLEVMEKANAEAKKAVENWEKVSPV